MFVELRSRDTIKIEKKNTYLESTEKILSMSRFSSQMIVSSIF